MELSQVILAALAVMGVALAGKIFSWRYLGGFLERNIVYLVSFAAGVLLVVVLGLVEEVLKESATLPYGLLWIVGGGIVVLSTFRLLPDFHHHHHEHEETMPGHEHTQESAKRILISDGLHNIGDGILIAGSFAVSPITGVFAMISIFLHEVLQETSEFFVLRRAGLSVNRAILYNFAVSSFTLVGAVGGYFLLSQFEAIEVPILGLSAGAYFVVVFFDLIPHSIRTSSSTIHYARHIAWFASGLIIMYLVTFAFGHGHEEDHADEVASQVATRLQE